MTNLNQKPFLTTEELKVKAPAIFATSPKQSMSDRYVFVPTNKILDNFAEAGWHPTNAFQSKSKVSLPEERKHVVRLSNPSFTPVMKEVGSLTPEIVLINSHNGQSNVKMEIGIFRLVCSNGLVISDSKFSQIKKRHSGTDKEEIFKVLYEAGKEFPDIWNKVSDYKAINLTKKEKADFATAAIEYNWSENSVITPEAILKPRRYIDESDDLFACYNVIQENIIKGGIEYINPYRNRTRHTKAIKNANRDIQVNQFLWTMMESFRTTKRFR